MRLVCRCPFKVRREAQRLPTHIHATRSHRRPLVLVPQCVSRTTRTNRWRPRVKQRLSFPRLPPVPVDSSRCICVPMAHSVDPTHVVGIWVGRRRTMSAGRAQRLPSTDKLSQSKQLQISVAIFASAQRHNVGARSAIPRASHIQPFTSSHIAPHSCIVHRSCRASRTRSRTNMASSRPRTQLRAPRWSRL